MDEFLTGIVLTIAIIASNIGARFIHLDFTEKHQNILSHPLTRVCYIYSMAFVGTRDWRVAGIVTGIYYAFLKLIR